MESTPKKKNSARARQTHRLDRQKGPSLQIWNQPEDRQAEKMDENVALPCGWGRLIFGQTFKDPKTLAQCLSKETKGQRDIALYIRDPHVVLSLAPQKFFLDPSNTYRLWLDQYHPIKAPAKGWIIRRVQSTADIEALNEIYARRSMVPVESAYLLKKKNSRTLVYLVLEEAKTGKILGTVLGVDHRLAFKDLENGSSLWALAVDPQVSRPGVGEALVRYLIEYFMARGRACLDVSVMHSNHQAIALYEKLGFQRVPVFCLKKKNPINEPLFVAPDVQATLNPYAEIIIQEARRRGIDVEIIDQEGGFFRLSMGGRSILCRESLTELTTAIAMSQCDDKAVTRRVFLKAGLKVPDQQSAGEPGGNAAFLKDHERVVVKPARGEQGAGISVDVQDPKALEQAIEHARQICPEVLLEAFHPGVDLRVIVIDYKVVAAAIRRPPVLEGNGKRSIKKLIEAYNRRRLAATGGESKIPIDQETRRILKEKGLTLDSVLPLGESLQVRKTANLHTGGTIHDVTPLLHFTLVEASVKAAKALKIPVVGLDFIVPNPSGKEYVLIEANERPGLANHEPQPTAERFMDLLFPQSSLAIHS